MELLRAMILSRFFVSFITALFMLPSALFANAQSEIRDVSGYVVIEDGLYHLIEAANQRRTRLAALTATVKNSLSKLKTHDYIAGTAELVGQSYILHSVDSVGLRRILGIWQSGNTMIEFQSFNALKFLNKVSTEYMYTLTPDSGSNWKVFLTDDNSVTLGAIRMNSLTHPNEMTFELFDSSSGSIIKKVHLKKVKK